jgi:hypothetical protein
MRFHFFANLMCRRVDATIREEPDEEAPEEDEEDDDDNSDSGDKK